MSIAAQLDEQQPLEWAELWAAMKEHLYAKRYQWTRTTEEMYHDQLGAVPPIAVNDRAFLVGEPYTHNSQGEAIYAAFLFDRRKNQYFSQYMTLRKFKEQRVGTDTP